MESVWHEIENNLTLLSSNLTDIRVMLKLGRAECCLSSSEFIQPEKRNVPVGAEMTVVKGRIKPAVSAELKIAARSVQEEQPAINDSTVSLKTEAHEPAKDVEGKERDVDQPDEYASAGPAPEEESKPNEVKDVVNDSDGGQDEPPWKSNQADDM